MNDPLFDSNYNEESDVDWASGVEDDTGSEGSSAPELLHAALRFDDDVDVEESDEESQYVIRKLIWCFVAGYWNFMHVD
jgi:hypothetical protein